MRKRWFYTGVALGPTKNHGCTMLLLRAIRKSNGFTMVLLTVKRTSNGFTEVLGSVQRKNNGFTKVLRRSNEKALVLHLFCLW